ncbi:S-protein homolog 5-like [Neltuma alba]|uniref:S-protein homolog 5-like n=1 Tax=Neltuma alba TaxID=207710 RepID=UPI0010A4D70F|nr:S-protein homolog 5-like [Prosopis alba]
MATNMKSLLLLLMVIAATLNDGKPWVLIPPKVTVRVINNFDPPQDVTVHCKSKDDDIGEHTIKVGDSFEFHFRPNAIVDVTLFFCSFRWASDPSLHYFDIYEERRDQWCTTCEWAVSQQGACIYNEAFRKYKCYDYTHSAPQATFIQPLDFNTSNNSTVPPSCI